MGGGSILAMGEKIRKLQLTFTKGLASLCLPAEGQDDMPVSSSFSNRSHVLQKGLRSTE